MRTPKLFGEASVTDQWRTLLCVKRSSFTDLADAGWESLSSHVPAPNKRERPTIHCSRLIFDTIFFYVLRSGCPWRLLPR